jgi:hypothetical protein
VNGKHSDATDEVAKMDPQLKEKWLGALRSGAYAQTKNRLRSPENGFCCLGVVCNVLNHDGWNETIRPNHGDPGYDWGSHGTGMVGEDLDRTLGLPLGTARTLSDMNDNKDATFTQIADWIEANL